MIYKHRFQKAMSKEVENNLFVGACENLTTEESARMESRFVLTAEPLEDHEVDKTRTAGILLDWTTGEQRIESEGRTRHESIH